MATEKLYPNGWDSGWPLGLLSNIDEPLNNPDGQTIATSSSNDDVTLDLDNTAITDLDTVTTELTLVEILVDKGLITFFVDEKSA